VHWTRTYQNKETASVRTEHNEGPNMGYLLKKIEKGGLKDTLLGLELEFLFRLVMIIEIYLD
jgi:hypothetical protein